MRWNARTRIVIASVFLGTVFTTFSARLVYLGVDKHEEYASLAARKNAIRQPIYARRGLILDRNGEILAENAPTRTVFADGSLIEDPKKTADIVAGHLGIEPSEVRSKIDPERKYVVIKNDVPARIAFAIEADLRAAGIRGIGYDIDSRRVHPNGPMLAHVLGFINHERAGVQGVELSLQDHLAGQNGFRYIERDRTGREIVVYRGQERAARDGMHVQLTIDMGIQSIVEEELDLAIKELNPQSAVVVLADPKTGDILAMATRPAYEPDDIASAQPEQMKNRAVIDMVEPGSTFKIVAAGAALEEGIYGTQDTIFCENGRFAYGGKILRDHHAYGHLTIHEIVMKSSNIGCAKLALKMGGQTYYEYVKRFGFGERTGIELPGEIPGVVHPPARWDNITITRMPMGHSVAVTPIQMVMAMSVIANGGNLMAPHIVKSITDSQGKPIREFTPTVVRRVINPETASLINEALADVVGDRGTARLAAVPGYRVAGKTGTAQRVDPNGGYTPGKYVVSFLGYMPVEDPAFVCLVLVDDAQIPSNLNYGGLVAAPIFARIAERTARYLDLPPVMRAIPVTEIATAGTKAR